MEIRSVLLFYLYLPAIGPKDFRVSQEPESDSLDRKGPASPNWDDDPDFLYMENRKPLRREMISKTEN
jgi:hypothetical protein